MPDDESKHSKVAWPQPKFHFLVRWGSQQVSFEEVAGLDVETQPIEYRGGNSPAHSTIKIPALHKLANVTLKKGVFKGDQTFWDWYKQIQTNTGARSTVTIKLLDDNNVPTMTWTLTNAWPTKISGPDLKTTGNEVTIETIELAHDGLTVAND